MAESVMINSVGHHYRVRRRNYRQE